MPSELSAFSLSELASRFSLELKGDADKEITGVGTLRDANSRQITFLANPGYRKDLASTQAGAVILKAEDSDNCPVNCLIAADPYVAYARIASLFDTYRREREDSAGSVHPSAVVDPTARLGQGVTIGPLVCIEAGCRIGSGCSIGAGTVIGQNSELGEDCFLYANVTISHGIRLGKRVIVHPGAVIGSDGFGIAFASDHWEKVPQLGSVVIGDDCEIGANTTIDRGAIDDTILEQDVRLDNQVQIAHNVIVGAHSALAAKSGIAGSTRIGKYCLLAGGAAVQGHIEIADRVTIAARSVAFSSIEEAGTTWSNLLTAQPIRIWQKNLSRLRRLDELARRLILIEKQTRKNDPND